MPESVKDRPTSAHEKIYLFAKNRKYYYDADAIRVPQKQDSIARAGRDVWDNKLASGQYAIPNVKSAKKLNQKVLDTVEEGKIPMANKRNVWTVTTKPFRGAHFAVFPPDLIEPCIKAGCPERVCYECGKIYIKNYDRKDNNPKDLIQIQGRDAQHITGNIKKGGIRRTKDGKRVTFHPPTVNLLGFKKDCNCKTDKYKKGTVLDPFGGSGTTGLVANNLGRDAVLIELNEDYVDIAKKRINDNLGLFSEVKDG
jgi:hypothetical protein